MSLGYVFWQLIVICIVCKFLQYSIFMVVVYFYVVLYFFHCTMLPIKVCTVHKNYSKRANVTPPHIRPWRKCNEKYFVIARVVHYISPAKLQFASLSLKTTFMTPTSCWSVVLKWVTDKTSLPLHSWQNRLVLCRFSPTDVTCDTVYVHKISYHITVETVPDKPQI